MGFTEEALGFIGTQLSREGKKKKKVGGNRRHHFLFISLVLELVSLYWNFYFFSF